MAFASLKGVPLECQITKVHHRIEKGLMFPSAGGPFGHVDERCFRIMMNGNRPQPATKASVYASGAPDALQMWNDHTSSSDVVAPQASSLGTFNIPVDQLEAFFGTRRTT